mgnify:CR=1 FL=1
MGNVKSIAFCLILLFLGVNAGNLQGQNKSQIQPYRIERIKKKEQLVLYLCEPKRFAFQNSLQKTC